LYKLFGVLYYFSRWYHCILFIYVAFGAVGGFVVGTGGGFVVGAVIVVCWSVFLPFVVGVIGGFFVGNFTDFGGFFVFFVFVACTFTGIGDRSTGLMTDTTVLLSSSYSFSISMGGKLFHLLHLLLH
jgi:hypothetical protein